MSNILNKASLLLNPAGSSIAYKEDKIHSVFPSNGDVDFNFVGGDGGTRVNQDGYIEHTPANFMLNSETSWTVYNTTLVTGITDPFGGTRAYAVSNINSGNVADYVVKSGNTMPLPAGTVITYSIYMIGTGTIATYVERGVAGAYWFNTKVHTLDPNKWTLFTHTYTVPTDASGVNVYVGNVTGTTSTYVQIAFPMVNIGSTAKPYQPTTDRLNYPRINFEGGAGAILTEDTRGNLALNSEEITSWSSQQTNSSGSADMTISPNGTQNADLYTNINNVGSNQIFQYVTLQASTYIVSGFYKYKSGEKKINHALYTYGTPSGWNGVTIEAGEGNELNLTTFGSATQAGSKKYKNGWYRVWFSIDMTAGGNSELNINREAIGSNANYNTGEWYVWGMQVEAAITTGYTKLPSSYIKTTSAIVTRNEDLFGTSDLSNAITGQEITWLAHMECSTDTPNGYGFRVFCTSPSGWLGMYRNTTGAYNDGSGAQYPNLGTFPTNKPFKMVAKAGGGEVKYFVNGNLVFTNTFSAPGSWISFENDSINVSRNYRTFAVWNEALSDTDCEELSTLKNGSGGSIISYGPYTIHTFTSSGTFTPSFSGEVEVLVVAGGGAGGAGGSNVSGAGGGAGGLMYKSSIPVTSGTNYTIVVGAGGAGTTPSSDAVGDPGTPSSAFNLNTTGGGGGEGNSSRNNLKQRGGSGGGGRESNGTGGETIDNQQGNVGGDGSESGNYAGGGGGAGQPGNTNGLGYGGDGLLYSISGYPTYYAGGGSSIGPPGGTESAEPGLGGGGKGRYGRGGDDGVTNTGGGGGGTQSAHSSGHGGSGIVIIRYLS